ncbi:MAG: hypothetical protein H7X80_09215, partial [bacterium]|nr:hypothetical protein [Candidatus Kapabacteria bacterium]
LFRDAFDSPGDTSTSVGARLPLDEPIDTRFIATRAEPVRDPSLRIVIEFNEPVDDATASDPANYTLRPIAETMTREIDVADSVVVSVVVDPNNARRVFLTIHPSYPIGALGNNYTVTVRNVRSRVGRVINNGTESVVGFVIEGTDLSALRVFPQPFSISRDGTVTFAGLPRDATVRVLDRNGRMIRTLRETEHNGGVDWDGRDESGSNVPSGIYLYSVSILNGAQTAWSEPHKIAVVP